MRKRSKTLRARIHLTPRAGARQPAVEPAEVLLMMETLSRWVNYDHRHKTFLSKELLWIAARLLNLRSIGPCWELSSQWPEIAWAAGIDLKSFNVIDPIKFGWFWYQLGETGRFDIEKQRSLIALNKEPPEIEPLIVTKPYWTPKVKQQKLHAQEVKDYQDNYMKETIIDHFFV